MTSDDGPEGHAARDAVAELSAYVRRLEQERQAETDPLRRQSLGLRLFHLKAELMRLRTLGTLTAYTLAAVLRAAHMLPDDIEAFLDDFCATLRQATVAIVHTEDSGDAP